MARIADVFIRLLSEATGFRKDVLKEAETTGNLAGQTLGARMSAAISRGATQMGAALNTAGAALAKTGSSMTRNLTLPIAAAGAAATVMALDFDTSLRQVAGLTDVTQEELAGIREEILAMGPAVGKGPQELVEAFYFVASAGFTASEAMDVLRTSAEASAAGLGDTQTIAQVLGGVLNAYGKENINAADAAGILTEAVAQGTAEASSFANVIGRVVPAAATLGVGFDEVTAALAGMTLTGLDAEEAAVGLNQVFVSLLKPTSQAQDALTAMGLSAEGLRTQLKEEGLLSVLRTLEERFGDDEAAAAKVFGNIRALRTVTSLLTLDTDQLNTVFEKVAGSGAKRLAEAYEETEGPGREMARAMADIQATAIELGDDVLPVLVEVLHGVAASARALGDFWRGLDDGTKRLVIQFLALVGALGPVLFISGKLLQGFGGIFKMVGFLTGAKGIPKLIGAVKAFGLVGAGWVALLVGITLGLGKAAEASGDWFRNLGKSGKQIKDFNALVEMTGEIKFAHMVDVWGISAEQFATLLEQAGGDASLAMKALQDNAGDLGAALIDLGQDAGNMSEHWAEAWRVLSTSTTTGVNGMLQVARKADVGGELAASIEAGSFQVGPAAEAMVDPIDAALQEAVQASADAANEIVDNLAQGLADAPKEIRDEVKALREALNSIYTTGARRRDIEQALGSQAVLEALRSDDPKIRAEAALQVKNWLAEYDQLAPGALARGELVLPALQNGINRNKQALLTYLLTLIPEITNPFDQADTLEAMGYGDIAEFARGIERAKILEMVPQITAAQQAAMGGWKMDLYSEGYATSSSYVNGLIGSLRSMFPLFFGALAPFINLFGFAGSPMYSHATELGEGSASHWLEAMVGTLKAGVPDLSSMLAFTPSAPYATAGRNFAVARGVAAGEAGGAPVPASQIVVNLPGRDRQVTAQNIGRDLVRLERMGKLRVRRDRPDD